MTRSEIARRKRQMNRRIRELVAIRRATMSFAAPAPVHVPIVPASAATVRPAPPPAPAGPVAIRERTTTRSLLFPQIAPPRQVKPSAPRSPLSSAKSTLPPVCP